MRHNAPIKIMRITTRLAVGGPGVHAILLTEKLETGFFTTKLVSGVAMPCEGDILDIMDRNNMAPLTIKSMGREVNPFNDVVALARLVRLMHQYRPHIVHTHTAKAGFLGRMAARLAGVPVIVHTFHGNIFRSYFSPPKTRAFAAIERCLSKFTDRIIVLSEQQRREIQQFRIGEPEQFRIIPLGLDLHPFLNTEKCCGMLREELGLSKDIPLVGIVARLVPIKAVDVLLHAIPYVLAKHGEVQFVVVGDGEMRERLEDLAEKIGVRSNVRFLGFRSDLATIYSDLDCFVLCSKNEGLPVAIIEAMASGCPVVATDVGSVKDLVQHGVTGCLAASGDPRQIANGISEVLSDPARATRWGQTARTRVFPSFDIDRLVRDITCLYSEVLREKGVINLEEIDPGGSRRKSGETMMASQTLRD